MTAAELHEYVRTYNWDDGVAPVLELLDDPSVDRATALLAYWLLQGPWHTYVPDVYGEHPHHEALRRLEERLLGAFYRGSLLSFNAETDLGIGRGQLYRLQKAGMPKALSSTS